MTLIRIDDMQMAYTDEGAGRAVVLIHGYPFNRSLWTEQIAALSRSYRVVVPDLRGFGETDAFAGTATMDRMAQAVAGLMEYTKNNPDYSDGFYLLGNAYAEVGQNAKAIEAYKKCLALNPRFTKANFNIGIIQIIEKNKAGALEQYNALLQTDKVLAEKLKAEIDKL